MNRQSSGRRLRDKVSVRLTHYIAVFWVGHYIGIEYPDQNLFGVALDLAEWVKSIIDALGGIAVASSVAMGAFTVYKYLRMRKNGKQE